MRKREPKSAKRDPDPRDFWNEKVYAECAQAMAKWLKGSVHLSRPLNSLTRTEITTLARVAVDTWIVAASHRLWESKDPDEVKKIHSLIG